ncbi:MAG: hypothetical protein IPJ23_14185 [Ignavibacteriales bacterium]|nr:hypothetical protein [Ignavibacteriales bacterium]
MDFVKRVQIAEVICKVNSIKNIDTTTEIWLNQDIRWLKETPSLKNLRAEDALLYIMNTLAKQYWIQGDTIKAHLSFGISGKNKPWETFFASKNPFNYNISNDYYKQPIEKIYKMIKSYDYWDTPWDEKHLSDWIKFLMDNYYYSLRELETILAKKYIAKGMFEEAVSKIGSHLENIDYYHQNSDVTEEFPADPFLIHINDCHDCDYRAENKVTYRLLSFSRRMIELKNLAVTEKNNEKASEYYFLLANGYYNITFYGNSWMASCFNSRGELGWGYSNGENYDLYDCSKAEDNYLKAAMKTKNKEFAALCFFMAAKCEQNRFYNEEHPEIYMWYSSKKTKDKEAIKFDKYKTYFKKLVNEYSNTQFVIEALKECKYFNYFVTNYTH